MRVFGAWHASLSPVYSAMSGPTITKCRISAGLDTRGTSVQVLGLGHAHLSPIDSYLAEHGALQQRQALWRLVMLHMLLQMCKGLGLSRVWELLAVIVVVQLHKEARQRMEQIIRVRVTHDP